MVAGYRGHLIATHVLEAHLATRAAPAATPLLTQAPVWSAQLQSLGPVTGLRAMLEAGAQPVLGALGFAHLESITIESAVACATAYGQDVRVALVVTRWGEPLDRFWRTARAEAGRRGTEWCLLFNGVQLRVVHSARFGSHRFAEFDLDLAADDATVCAAVMSIASAASFSPQGHRSVVGTLVQASDAHRSAVCRALKNGVLEASTAVLKALIDRRGSPDVAEAFEQSLIVVYRVLFLLFAEARVLVPLWHPVYRNSYSLERLRERAVSGACPGLWDALRAITRLAHAGCRAGNLTVTPFNGRLFAPARTPLAERRTLNDDAARLALLALTMQQSADHDGSEPIGYRDLGVEQLGAVYETLLDYEPHVERPRDRARRLNVSLRAGSGARKASGSFYTPQSIAGYLIRETIGPLVRGATPDQILRLRVLDPAMGSGAFLVAACAYLTEAYELALVESGGCHPHDLGHHEHALIRRTIAERCLYGVDLNPMAVQLARLSLWLATLAADRPLSFLDHHLQVGDSLIGAWLRQLRQPPGEKRSGRREHPLLDLEPAPESVSSWLPVRFRLAAGPSDTPEQIRAKERELATLNRTETTLSKWRRVADLWCAHWFSGELSASRLAFRSLSDHILNGAGALPDRIAARLLRESETTATAHRFFHWELEFPEVFFDASGVRAADGGFDAVIGNPPWEMLRADSGAATDREVTRHALNRTVRFTRESGVYGAQSDGHVNRYQLFLERAMTLTRPGGRVGLVLPSGLATDAGSAMLRRQLLSNCRVEQLIGFENRRAIFPIHRSVRFLLLTAEAGAATTSIACRFGEHDPAMLDAISGADPPAAFPLSLTPSAIARLSGDSFAIPELRTARDLTIAERAAALFAPLGSERSWHARFGRELNATEDRPLFRSDRRGLTVVGGKQLQPFRVDLAGTATITSHDADRLLGDRHHHPRLAYRDVAGATNRVTLIAAMLPAGCVSTHTIFCLRSALPLSSQHFLCGLFNTLVVNYLVRLRVATHVTTAIIERLPIPRQDQAGSHFDTIVGSAKTLLLRDDASAWAALNATAAQLYQLTADEFRYVLDTFPLIPEPERDRCDRAFRTLAGGW